MRITVLIENSAPAGSPLQAEHGLSFWVQTGGCQLLLDAGETGAFWDNALALGLDPRAAELAVLSHGHHDHANGLVRFLAGNGSALVYLRQGAWGESRTPEGDYIGMDPLLRAQAHRFRAVEGLHQLFPGAWLAPPPEKGREADPRLLYRDGDGGLAPDAFLHEQSLVLDEGRGLVVLSPCSHRGIDHIAAGVAAAFPDRPVLGVLGGFHLRGSGPAGALNRPPEAVRAMARRLLELGVERVWTGHCTGQEAWDLLKEELGERLQPLHTGLVLEL